MHGRKLLGKEEQLLVPQLLVGHELEALDDLVERRREAQLLLRQRVAGAEAELLWQRWFAQVHLHDGRNILLDESPDYKTGDSLVISLPDQKVSSHMEMKKGATAYLTGGSHIGEIAKIKDHEVKRSSKPNETSFEDFGTITDYVFVIGKESDIPKEAES